MPTDLLALLSPKTLILFIIVFTRLSGLITSIPLISNYPIPMQVKVWFMATVSFIMFPIVMAKVGFQVPTNLPELAMILLKEFLVGYITGFIANVVFVGVEICANLVSMQMGLTAAQALNPATGNQAPIFAQSYTILASFIFIGMNAYQWILGAIFKSFQIIPPGYSMIIDGHFTHNVVQLTSQMFSIGLGLALPIFSVLLINDILLGFVSKMMPKMNIFMVSLPVKIFLGLVLSVMLIPQMCVHIKLLLDNYLTGIIKILGG